MYLCASVLRHFIRYLKRMNFVALRKMARDRQRVMNLVGKEAFLASSHCGILASWLHPAMALASSLLGHVEYKLSLLCADVFPTNTESSSTDLILN